MTDIGFDRPNHQWFFAFRAEHSRQRLHFDWITKRCSCAMRFDITDLFRSKTRTLERRADNRFLRWSIRGSQSITPPILVDRRPSDQRQDMISVRDCIREALQDDDAAAFAAHETVGTFIEGFAASIGGKHVGLGKSDGNFRF